MMRSHSGAPWRGAAPVHVYATARWLAVAGVFVGAVGVGLALIRRRT